MSAEDAEAKKLMTEMGLDGEVASDDESEGPMDPEEILEQFRRTVVIEPDNCIDQIVLGTSDVDKAVDDFEKLTGTRPVWVTSMNGAGTKSARVAFESCAYLEIIGPDPKQPDTSTEFSKALSKLSADEFTPVHYAVRLEKSGNLDVRNGWTKDTGLIFDQITMVAKDRGMPWLWDMYFFKGDGLHPFFTHWKDDAMHASAKLPIVGKLEKVSVAAPADHAVHKLLESPQGVDLSTGSGKLEFTISSSKGSHTFSCSDPIGISFPDEGGIEVK
jgi:hypothetical protein